MPFQKFFFMLAFFGILNNTSAVMGHTPNLSLPTLLLSPLHAYTMGKYDIAQRTLVLTMKTLGMEPRQISDITDIPTVTINTIWNRAIERGFDPRRQPLMITDAYVIDAPRSGRPKKTNI
jgi:hypothetical protein